MMGMDVAPFEALANQHGLVLMQIRTGFYPPYPENSFAGFPPDRAATLYADGDAVPVDTEGNLITVVLNEGGPPAADPVPMVRIPHDWETIHHLQRIRLAKTLGGNPATAEEADEFIRAELLRRNGA
jgi:hypothetical protein